MKLRLWSGIGMAVLLSGCTLFHNPVKDYVGVWGVENEKRARIYIHPDGTVVITERQKVGGICEAEPDGEVLALKVKSGREFTRHDGKLWLTKADGKVRLHAKRSGRDKEEDPIALIRLDASLDEDPSSELRRSLKQKQGGTPDYMPVNFSPVERAYETPDGRVAVMLLKEDNIAVVRTGDRERHYFTRAGWNEGTVKLLASRDEKDVRFKVTADGRLIEYGTTGAAEGKEIGLPVAMKKIKAFEVKQTAEPYYGIWKGKLVDQETRVTILKDGRIICERMTDKGPLYEGTLKYQLRHGMLFAFIDEGPDQKNYEDWHKFRFRYDAETGALMATMGDNKEERLVRVAQGCDPNAVRDELEERLKEMKACRYDGVWEGGESFHSFAFAFDEDGQFMMVAGMGGMFGTWTAKPDGTIKVTLENGEKMEMVYLPHTDRMQAKTRQGHRGRRKSKGPAHPVRRFKEERDGRRNK